MYFNLKIIGVILIALGLLHIIFPKYFNWKAELKPLSLINRQMMIVHAFFIAIMVFLMGLLCLFSTADLIETKLGRTISLGLGIFWSIRLLVQFFGYSSKLWKGKIFETIIHIFFSTIWMYLSLVFFTNAFI